MNLVNCTSYLFHGITPTGASECVLPLSAMRDLDFARLLLRYLSYSKSKFDWAYFLNNHNFICKIWHYLDKIYNKLINLSFHENIWSVMLFKPKRLICFSGSESRIFVFTHQPLQERLWFSYQQYTLLSKVQITEIYKVISYGWKNFDKAIF